MQGGSAQLTDTAQRRHCQLVIWSLINSTYLRTILFFFTVNGKRLSQEPQHVCIYFSNQRVCMATS